MARRVGARGPRLGDVLVEHGLITREQRRLALRRQKEGGARLGEVLVSEAILSRDQLNWALGNLLHIPYVYPDAGSIAPELLAVVPLDVLRRCRAVPMARFGGRVTVAMADPTDLQAVEELGSALGAGVNVAMADPAAIEGVFQAISERAARAGRARIVPPFRLAGASMARLREAWRRKR